MTATATRIIRTASAIATSLGVAAGILLAASPANATAAAGPYTVTATPYLNEHNGPSTADAVVGNLPHGSTTLVACQTTGTTYNGTDIWDKLPNGSYVTDDLLTTPVFDGFSPGIARCPAPPAPAVKTGRTATGNEGTPGQCTSWAITEFHAFTGLYPYLLDPANDGNAEYWATNAAYDGWTVTATPRINSIVVFPSGVNGAESDGHVAWVTKASGGQITFTEMNGTAGPGLVDTRTVTPAASVRYILAP
jgi:surface antigen